MITFDADFNYSAVGLLSKHNLRLTLKLCLNEPKQKNPLAQHTKIYSTFT